MSAEIEFISPTPYRGNQHVLDLTSETGQGPAPESTGRLNELLTLAVDRQAADLHLVVGNPPVLRVNGRLETVGDTRLRGGDVQQMLSGVVPARPDGRPFDEARDIDCSVTLPHPGGAARFRLNAYKAQGVWNACLRYIPSRVPTLESLGFPEHVAQRLLAHDNGLVIFAGTTGSGKSSSMAALIQLLAERGRRHVLTIEEPIEYLYASRKGSLFSQREVGRDVESFAHGLKYGLRQDPDVILVGETRDRETAQMVLSAAETGHLVFTTLHTRDAKGALTRFVDLFPADSQEDVRKQLALSLRSVVSQQLLASGASDGGRTLVCEVLHVNQQSETAIRSGRVEMLDNVIQTGRRDGMCTFEDDAQRLVKLGRLPADIARRFAAGSAPAGRSGSW